MTTRQVQDLLHYLGYDVEPDGISGPQTVAAIKAFQAERGLATDGNPGSAVFLALKDAVANDKFKSPGTWWDDIPNFTRREFACQCGRYCGGFPAEPKESLVRLAQAARDHFGRPATVVSGLRCPRHNASVGGVANSQHMAGEACDLRIQGISAGELLAFFQSQPGVRYAYAINETNVHFDIPKGGS